MTRKSKAVAQAADAVLEARGKLVEWETTKAGAEADPDTEAPPDAAIVERIGAWVRDRFPDLDPNPVETQTCIYTTTPDESFILERRGRVVVGSACSGHGFKFAPAVGRRLADLALG